MEALWERLRKAETEIIGGLVVLAVSGLIGKLINAGWWTIAIAGVVGVWAGCAYLAFKRTPSPVSDARRIWKYPRGRGRSSPACTSRY